MQALKHRSYHLVAKFVSSDAHTFDPRPGLHASVIGKSVIGKK